MKNDDCIFCDPDSDEIFLTDTLCFARWDSYPVGEGHALIIPSRHVADYFDVTNDERQALWGMVDRTKEFVADKFKPDGFNVGINIGAAAGQSVFHLHIHLIPRYKGDTENPKGGVRGVIPGKQKYQRRVRI